MRKTRSGATTTTASAEVKNSGRDSYSALARKRKLATPSSSENDTEEQIEEPPISMKKQRKNADIAQAANKIAERTRTAHYPTSALTKDSLKAPDASKKHSSILVELVESISSAELKTLKKFFATEFPDSAHDKILNHLTEVLTALPEKVDEECPLDVLFLPEVTRAEKMKIESNKNELMKLNDSIEKLNEYVDNPEKFFTDMGLINPESFISVAKSNKKNSHTNKVWFFCVP